MLHADSPFAELEQISDSWTKQSFTGIRALPENLEHGFRQRALYETVMRGMCPCNMLPSPCQVGHCTQHLMVVHIMCTCNKLSVHHQQRYTSTLSHCSTASTQISAFIDCCLIGMLMCTSLDKPDTTGHVSNLDTFSARADSSFNHCCQLAGHSKAVDTALHMQASRSGRPGLPGQGHSLQCQQAYQC